MKIGPLFRKIFILYLLLVTFSAGGYWLCKALGVSVPFIEVKAFRFDFNKRDGLRYKIFQRKAT